MRRSVFFFFDLNAKREKAWQRAFVVYGLSWEIQMDTSFQRLLLLSPESQREDKDGLPHSHKARLVDKVTFLSLAFTGRSTVSPCTAMYGFHCIQNLKKPFSLCLSMWKIKRHVSPSN